MEKKILFVCRGNVARSQIAKSFLKKFTGIDADSAGTEVFDEEGSSVGDVPAAQPIIRLMREDEGIDISQQRRRQITPEMIKKYDKIITMAEPEFSPDYLKNCPKAEYWPIKDPVKMDDKEIREIISQIKSRVLEFIDKNKIKKVI